MNCFPSLYASTKSTKNATNITKYHAGTTTTLPVSVKCATGWTPHSNMCYKKFTQKVTWTAAEENCKNNGGDLASVKDKATNDFLKTFWTMDPVTPMAQRAFWLGGINTQDGGEWKWKWSADSTVFDSTVKDNWAKGKPSKRTDENDNYLWLRRDGKWLDDKRKSARRGYFCQKNSE